MKITDLSNQKLLEELDIAEQKIMQLRRQRSGIDGELEAIYFRKNEIQKEINKRFKGVDNEYF